MYKNNPDRSPYTKQLLPEYFLDGERNAMVVLKYFFFLFDARTCSQHAEKELLLLTLQLSLLYNRSANLCNSEERS